MVLLGKFNGYYTLTSGTSKDDIIGRLRDKINEAAKQTGWFNFNIINYKYFFLRNDVLMIFKKKLRIGFFFQGTGRLKVKLNSLNKGTLIEATIIPFGDAGEVYFWICFGFSLLSITLLLFLLHGPIKYLTCLVPCLLCYATFFINFLVCRYSLKLYLMEVFEDLNIDGHLSTINKIPPSGG
jgi:hypothetical protein